MMLLLSEFSDEIDGWVIETLNGIGWTPLEVSWRLVLKIL